ncbi:hypothetical protein PATSB16_41670 [Pandoraea thiooxydans]|nr:hypothetical protein PATSB16_41670 [Pandoraea thiooxydans]
MQPVAKRKQQRRIGTILGKYQVIRLGAAQARFDWHEQPALIQRILHQKARHERHAHAADGGLHQHAEQLELVAGAHVAGFSLKRAGMHAKPVAPRIQARRLVQQCQFGQPGRVPRKITRRPACEQRRAADRHDFLAEQIFDSRTRPDRIAEMDGRIEPRIFEQERPGARGQVDHNVGMGPGEARQARNQPLRGERRQHGQLDLAAFALTGDQIERVGLEIAQVGAHLLPVRMAGLGQRHPPLGAMKQLQADHRLERADLPTDRALRVAQLFGRARKTLMTCGCLEGNQRQGTRDHAAHWGSGGNGRVGWRRADRMLPPSASVWTIAGIVGQVALGWHRSSCAAGATRPRCSGIARAQQRRYKASFCELS